ncbi:mandelate racemase/muconate lactonizing enzyme family protein [Rhodobium gokarnense]|uniref:Galactonate dehydratase n=1 Tax=Rhodobium gokarnense TaxID=364296 RepID=A0ABT3HG42_9HYPH|nr:mandelate racemase/muconate lactonizing enzyme family protein [Rhodobium gokarnense]MCW2309371.1 galactonate dehydratase [Rhodobium gokarnense]
MKITSATVYHVKGEGLKPIILKLETDAGIVGLGEPAPSFGCGGGGTVGMIKDLCERFIVGQDPTRINALTAEMIDQSFWLRNPGGIASSALSAIELALWDIRARALDVPVYDLFGGRMRDGLDYYANGWYFGAKSKAEVISQAEAAVKDGHRALKMYPLARIRPNGTLCHPSNRFADDRMLVAEAVAFVRDVRAAIGPDVLLMLDLAGGLSHGDTIRFCREIEDYDISFVEEIIDPGDLGAMAQIAPHINIPIATGERHFLLNGYRDLLETRSVSILQPDVGSVGGFAEAFKVAALGEAYGLKLQPHVCAGSVGVAIGMHLSACIRNFYIQEHFPYWSTIPGYIEVATESFESCARNGALPIPEGPGFGVTLNDAVMRDHVFAHLD